MDIVLRNEVVEQAKAGDKCIITGTVIVVPDISQLYAPGKYPEASKGANTRGRDVFGGNTGLKALGCRDLTYKLSFLGCRVQPAEAKVSPESVLTGV